MNPSHRTPHVIHSWLLSFLIGGSGIIHLDAANAAALVKSFGQEASGKQKVAGDVFDYYVTITPPTKTSILCACTFFRQASA